MAIGKIETVILNVKEINAAVKLYGEVFGIKFDPIIEYSLPGGIGVKGAHSKSFGLYLLQQTEPPLANDNVRAFTVMVEDVEKVKSDMEKRGIPLLREIKEEESHLQEAVYNMGGYYLIFAQHDDWSDSHL